MTTAVQGFAATYRRAFFGKRGLCALAPGCFSASLASGREVAFLHDHDFGQRIGSNREGLSLYDHADGLAFRYETPPASVIDAVRSGQRRSMSAGIKTLRGEKIQANGVEFELIHEAEIREISLVHRPAIANTSIAICNLAEVGSLQHCAESGSFALRGQHSALCNDFDDLCAMAAEKLEEGAALMRDFVAYARASNRSAARSHRRADKRRAMPIVDLTFARDAYARQPGAWETYMFMAGEDAFSDYVNSYTRRSAQ